MSFKRQLEKFLSRDQILDQGSDLRLYDTDATSLFKTKPLMVLLPNDSLEVARIIKTINEYNSENPNDRLNFVARGAGTGLSGGAIAAKNSIIISLARLNKLLELDAVNRCALVETGIVNQSLSDLCQHEALHFAPDPSSQKACTIGGNIAENAGGIHCFKYGVTSDHILGLEVVLPNAQIIYLGALEKDSNEDGYKINGRLKADHMDLSGLFIGSEGTYGIATKALVRLTPNPESFLTMQICFDSVRGAAELVAAIIRYGYKPAALEMVDTVTIQAIDKAFDLGFAKEFKNQQLNAILLIELDGDNDEILVQAKKIKSLAMKFKPLKYEETQDPARRTLLWKARKGAAAAFGQIAPYWYLYDAVVPRSKIPDALDGIKEIADRHNLLLANILHAGDGNLHPNFLYDPDKDPTVIERIHSASTEIMKLCVDMGGTLSGEHGIGVEKQEYMDYLFSSEDMETMIKVREVFDPEHSSNPNKLFPLRLCKYC